MAELGDVSERNTTSTPLAANGVFSGGWDDSEYPQFLVNMTADQAGTLTIEVGIPTPSGVVTTFNVDIPVAAGQRVYKPLVKGVARRVRVSFTNGGTAQGQFALLTEFGSHYVPSIEPEFGGILVTSATPARTTVDQATLDGLSYVASTPVETVGTTEEFFVTFANPANSGRRVFLYNRLFSNNQAPADPHLNYRAYVNPTAVLANQSLTANANIGAGLPSQTVMRWEKGTVTMGGIQATGEQLPNGEPYSRPLLAVLEPGVTLGFSTQPQGNNSFEVDVSIILEWYEEII